MKREQKKSQLDQQQLELRLNRALEEIEKLKSQLSKASATTKDSGEQDKKRHEHMTLEIKRLHKQKQELVQAFKKQLKLIDILKKQKMHLEAARMLQFTEEDFINALEWNHTSNATTTTTSKINMNTSNQRPPPSSSSNSILNAKNSGRGVRSNSNSNGNTNRHGSSSGGPAANKSDTSTHRPIANDLNLSINGEMSSNRVKKKQSSSIDTLGKENYANEEGEEEK